MTFKYALKFVTKFAENKLNGCETEFLKTGVEAIALLREKAVERSGQAEMNLAPRSEMEAK